MSVGRAKPTKESPRTLRARGLWGIRNRLTEDQFRAELVAIEQEAGQEIADGRLVELYAELSNVLEILPAVESGRPGYAARRRLEKLADGSWESGS